MNLRVDLILQSEQRSGSRVTMAAIGRVAAIVVPSILAVVMVLAFARYRALQSDLQESQAKWRELEPQYRSALALQKDLFKRKVILLEIDGWRSARVEWSRLLRSLQTAVPSSVQFTELRGESLIQSGSNRTARVFRLQIKGKTGGVNAQENVTRLRRQMLADPAVTSVVESVEIPPGAFEQDPSAGASKYDRVFEVVCRFMPSPFQ